MEIPSKNNPQTSDSDRGGKSTDGGIHTDIDRTEGVYVHPEGEWQEQSHILWEDIMNRMVVEQIPKMTCCPRGCSHR